MGSPDSPNPIEVEALLGVDADEAERSTTARLLRRRRLRLGHVASLLFENRETVRRQIQAVLRCEGDTPQRRRRVLADYEPLLPRPGELRATVMVDGATSLDEARAVTEVLYQPGGLELRCAHHHCPSAPTSPAVGALDPVVYLRWRPSAALLHVLGDLRRPLWLSPGWSPIVPVPAAVRAELLDDLCRSQASRGSGV